MRKQYKLSAEIDEYSYFHCIANATRKHHQSDQVSFDERDKNYLLSLLQRLEKLYAGIEVLQYCIMGTHVHLVLGQNNKMDISRKEVKELYEEFHNGLHDMDARSDQCFSYRKRLNDISCFMRDFQWYSATHFNAIRRIAGKLRFGSIWDPKFNCGLLEGGKAVRQCSLYVAMNPVRANLVIKAEVYKWSSWGERKLSGKDPHERALKKYFVRYNDGERTYNVMIELFGKKIDNLEAAQARKREQFSHKYSKHEQKYLKENPLWHEKKFIGSKKFCQEMRGSPPPIESVEISINSA